MSRVGKKDPDKILIPYKTFSKRATRFLFLQQVAEDFLKNHQAVIDVTTKSTGKERCIEKARIGLGLKEPYEE